MGRPRTADTDPSAAARRERWRASNRRAKDVRRPVHRRIIAEFLDGPCLDCGRQYDPLAMVADHVRGKKYKISWFKDGNGSTRALLEELAKCELRCCNCHAIRHGSGGTSEEDVPSGTM